MMQQVKSEESDEDENHDNLAGKNTQNHASMDNELFLTMLGWSMALTARLYSWCLSKYCSANKATLIHPDDLRSSTRQMVTLQPHETFGGGESENG